MRARNKMTFMYIPQLGFIQATDNMDENMKRIEQAKAKQEIEDKKHLRKLKREHPNCTIQKLGDSWLISEPTE